jgi:uncharacterized protein YbaR (Trm112 family)
VKLWLLELLACPLDHAFPLACTIFRWRSESTETNAITTALEAYRNRIPLPSLTTTPLAVQSTESALLIRDNLIIKPTPFPEYLQQLIDKLSELEVVHDLSDTEGEQALTVLRTELKQKLIEATKKITSSTKVSEQEVILKSITPDLEFLNYCKYTLEVEDAVLECPHCNRWYPVFETIPQLLPDNLRDKAHDNAFMKQWKAKFTFPASHGARKD